MGFKGRKFDGPPVEAQFEYNDDTLHLTINAAMMTRDFFDRIAKMNARTQPESKKKGKPSEADEFEMIGQTIQAIDFMAECLARVIIKWDVEEDDGKPIPVSAAFLRGLPVGALGELFNFVKNVNSPKAPTAETSGAIS